MFLFSRSYMDQIIEEPSHFQIQEFSQNFNINWKQNKAFLF
ncbi:hypothetical protein pb186bvf_007282 [Paramecium bursaria]